jgi:hypothetical protein
MIYVYPGADQPIRQGDIFFPLPSLTFDLDNITIQNVDGVPAVKQWENVATDETAIIGIEKTWGIVASQDCDASHSLQIAFFVIKPYTIPTGTPTPKSWCKIITTAERNSPRTFYLPIDSRIGFITRQQVNFNDIIQVPRASLEPRVSTLRKGRLNDVADEHFRESIAQFFRRYPYNEWYPLDKDEFDAYKSKEGDVKPVYPWQADELR